MHGSPERTGNTGGAARLTGGPVTLRPATLADRERIWRWLACSDLTPEMLGPPHFPEQSAPDFAAFCADYAPHYFTGDATAQGRSYLIEAEGEVWGHINYNDVVESPWGRATELDIWLRGSEARGRGLGPAAIDVLCGLLRQHLGVRIAFIRPARRNTRAIRAYEKAGFRRVDWDPATVQAALGPDDYGPGENLYLMREL